MGGTPLRAKAVEEALAGGADVGGRGREGGRGHRAVERRRRQRRLPAPPRAGADAARPRARAFELACPAMRRALVVTAALAADRVRRRGGRRLRPRRQASCAGARGCRRDLRQARVASRPWSGKPLLVNLWGSWCHPCRDEAKELRAFLARHPGTVLGIDVEDSKPGARGFQQRYKRALPEHLRPEGRARRPAEGDRHADDVLPRPPPPHRRVALRRGLARVFERGWKLATAKP